MQRIAVEAQLVGIEQFYVGLEPVAVTGSPAQLGIVNPERAEVGPALRRCSYRTTESDAS